MFCAIATTIERCKTEGVVDVFQVVKAQRIQKPGLVLTVVSIVSPSVVFKHLFPLAFTFLYHHTIMQEQYQFVFEAVLTFLETFALYSNFK